ncbi:hypothetical protein [Microcystis sp. M061S2]|uniref:hypothetical protein n=1 Tax=Microcystis sp. M061S2 TaxID=2771171 RepID=UPI002583A4F7|nr:hypothetical protein [Microcystis sp. M061S2]MCA2653277.1 hypothetical protein [Microcystis sp. M061S2]
MRNQNRDSQPLRFRSSISKGSASRRARSFILTSPTDDQLLTPNPTNKLFQQTLFSQFFEDKGIGELLGEEIKTDYIIIDIIGRVMDEFRIFE